MGVAALLHCLINRTHKSDELTDESVLQDRNMKKKKEVLWAVSCTLGI